MVFPIIIYGCESWTIKSWVQKNFCFWTVVLEKTLESPLGSKEIQPVHPKGNQSWIFIGRTDAEAESPILWPPDTKKWLIGKDSDAGKGWRQEEKGMTEDEVVWRHYWLHGHEFEHAPGVADGQGNVPGKLLLQSLGSQRVKHNWAPELNWIAIIVTLGLQNILILQLKVCTQWLASPHLPHSMAPGKQYSILLLWVQHFLDSTCKWEYEVFVFVSLAYFTPAWCPPEASMLSQRAELPSF